MPEEPELKVGDKVRTHGVSYVMKVAEIYGPIYLYRYRCSWTASDGTTQYDLFRREQLELIGEE